MGSALASARKMLFLFTSLLPFGALAASESMVAKCCQNREVVGHLSANDLRILSLTRTSNPPRVEMRQ